MDDPEYFEPFRTAVQKIPLEKGIGLPGSVFTTGKQVWVPDAQVIAADLPVGDLVVSLGLRSALFLPVLIGSEVVGVLFFVSLQVEEPDRQFLEAMDDVGTQLGRVIERKRAETELRDAELRSRTLLEGSPVCNKIIDLDSRLLYMSSAGQEQLKIADLTSLYGRTYPPDFYAESMRAPLVEHLDRAKAGEICSVECPVLDTEGGEVWYHTTFVPARNDAGRIEYIIASSVDITDRKRAENALRDAHDGLERRVRERTAEVEAVNKELEAFTYSVSHNLRAPVRHLGGFAEILLNEHIDSLSSEARRYVKIIGDSAVKMGILIDELLALSRLGRQPVNKERVDCEQLVREAWAEISSRAQTGRAGFDLQPLPTVLADVGLLRQVWINLLENSVKYSAGSTAPRIWVDSTQADGCVWFRVRDNGAGFDQHYAQKLFGAFQRLHKEEEFPGTGVGLAVVERIVHRHGGVVRGFGEVNKGATFEFTLGS